MSVAVIAFETISSCILSFIKVKKPPDYKCQDCCPAATTGPNTAPSAMPPE
ncbi:MAG: hypothetical protein WCF03_11395 [Nitrososphaeraceae archaeon]